MAEITPSEPDTGLCRRREVLDVRRPPSLLRNLRHAQCLD